MKKNVIVSLADANYFPLLDELINSIKKFKESGGTSNRVANFPIIKFPDQNKAANVRKV